ncbi:ATP-binding protein [Celeribacter sp.]|uniref:ATP-binding protein n=1 Tax=Celeribacter sp. TaxID=1890673 RepID=UPI003A8F3761
MLLKVDPEFTVRPERILQRVSMKASNTSVRKALRSLKAALTERGLLSEEVTSIELVLAETLNNIVEHAYDDTGEGMIEVKVSGEPGRLKFKVTDRGQAMPNGEPPLGVLAPINGEINDLPEGGFGWFLIRELAHDLRYVRNGNSNVFSFCMNSATNHDTRP